MASELNVDTTSGLTVYALIRNSSSRIWDGSSYVVYSTPDYTDYAVPMTEQGSSGTYVGDFPSSSAAGQYSVTYKHQAGGTPDDGDSSIFVIVYNWLSTVAVNTTTAPSGESYCASGDVGARLSQAGIELRTDDDPATITDCIANASSDIDLYLLPLYAAADIAENRFVHFACRALSVYYVCGRRNEPVPASVLVEYEKTMLQLEAIANGSLTLPSAAKLSGVQMRVSNNRYDNTRFPQIRVSRARSTPAGSVARRNYDDTEDRVVR